MSEFKRSPSKVWWGSESIQFRESSSSPGSQDSGFSDTENSSHHAKSEKGQKSPPAPKIPTDIFKESLSQEKPENLSSNFIEKCTPEKSLAFSDRIMKSEPRPAACCDFSIETGSKSEPTRKHRYTKHSPKVSRNLFPKQKSAKDASSNQYAENVSQGDTTAHSHESDSRSWLSNTQTYSLYNQSLPALKTEDKSDVIFFTGNQSAPAVLENIADRSWITVDSSSLSSDCDSELECLFASKFDSPKLTSTPKAGTSNGDSMRYRKRLLLKQRQDRSVSTFSPAAVDNDAVKVWLDEARRSCEQECMTALQAKSIAGELNQRVSQLASRLTQPLQELLEHAARIEGEYRAVNSQTKHTGPLAQSLAGNIMEYIKSYTDEMDNRLRKLYDDIRRGTDDSLTLLNHLLSTWHSIHYDTLVNEVKSLTSQLEDPASELDLRAVVTGITSVALRNEELIELFAKVGIIPVLVVLCEKCEGPTVRSLLLRALSTMCCSTTAIRQLEKFSGVQIIADSLEDESRPEPERSEAVALLAQITAPWIEDNHSIRGLQDHSKKLVKALTKFVSSTKCCQNLLLCSAALANLTTMDSRCIKYLLHQQTAKILLNTVKKRGPGASVYMLEQVATLLANMAAVEEARKQLSDIQAPAALLSFLNRSGCGDEVEKRLQQKSIIALSRLSGVKKAADQIVKLGGIEKLVKLCKEKDERYDSDAVLVASLATLRKIISECGSKVISIEDAQELVEPKLLDSFLAYSSQSESYV